MIWIKFPNGHLIHNMNLTNDFLLSFFSGHDTVKHNQYSHSGIILSNRGIHERDPLANRSYPSGVEVDILSSLKCYVYKCMA
jgi:hypothetical protein